MNSNCFFNSLTVGCWNIEGIYENVNAVKLCKIRDQVFLKTLNNFDILCLQETHVAEDDYIPIPKGFRLIPHCSNYRYFGGFLILVRQSISRGIKIGKSFDDDAFKLTLLKNNENVTIKVLDSGEGIEQKNMKRVFEPFFTTRPEGQGQGLGLSTAYTIVEKHKGKISVNSKVGKGTVVTIALPIISEAESTTAPE